MSRRLTGRHDPTAAHGIQRALPDDISTVLRTIRERDREILVSYLAGGVTIAGLAQSYGMTRRQIRGIVSKSISALLHPSRGGLIRMLWDDDPDGMPVRSKLVAEILKNREVQRCGYCGEPLAGDSFELRARLRSEARAGGRTRKWCSGRCRQAAYNVRRRGGSA